MSIIVNLSLELFDAIFSYRCVSHAFLKLWICGNKALQTKLANGITVVRLYDERLQTNSRFPKILTFLRSLRSLTVHRAGLPLGDPILLFEMVKMLPPSLEELNLSIYEATMILSDCAHRTRLQPSLTPTVEPPHLVKSEDGDWKLATAFPKLKSLSLGGNLNLSPIVARELPLGLETLQTAWNCDGWDFEALPRGLTKLVVTNNPINQNPENLRFLPPNLIELQFANLLLFSKSVIAELPRSLSITAGIALELTAEISEIAPPALAVVELYRNVNTRGKKEPITIFFPLPPFLTRLQTNRVGPEQISGNFIRALPRTLCFLDVLGIDFEDLHIGDLPNLEVLCSSAYETNEALDEEKIRLLPSSLHTLSYIGESSPISVTNVVFTQMPKLKSLHLCVHECVAEESFDAFLPAPQLRLLRLQNFPGDRIYKGSEFRYQPFATLPNGLRALLLEPIISSLAVSQLRLLPGTLETLQVGILLDDWKGNQGTTATAFDESTYFKHLPRNLTSLQVANALKLSDPTAFEALPPNLRTLSWRRLSDHFSYPHGLLHYLPPFLKMIIMHVDFLTNEDIAALPRTLKTMKISCDRESGVTLNSVHLFPPSLDATYLGLRLDLRLPQKIRERQLDLARRIFPHFEQVS